MPCPEVLHSGTGYRGRIDPVMGIEMPVLKLDEAHGIAPRNGVGGREAPLAVPRDARA